MKQKAPHVYIGGHLMESYATSNHPVLAGLSFSFGVDTDLDYPAGDTCNMSLVVRDTEDLDFLQLGEEVAVYHEPDTSRKAQPGDVEFTYFTGRIQRLSGDPHPSIKGALLLDVECSDLTADLAAIEVQNVSTIAAKGSTRLGNLNYWLPDPWVIRGWVRWPDLMHAPMIFDRIRALDMIDAFARAQILRRRNGSTFSPKTGIKREIHLMEDSTKDTRADQLTFFGTSTRWGTVPGKPYGPDVSTVNLDGFDFHRAAGWVKEPEDVITEVKLELLDDLEWNADEGRYEESETFDRSSADFPVLDSPAMKARFGHRQATFVTDLGRTATSTHLVPIMKHWLSTASDWRPSELKLATSKNLSLTHLRMLLGVHHRFSSFAVVRGVMDHRPDAGNQWIRGFVIGGSATWNGTEWEISLRLGRNPEVTAGMGDWWTLERLAASATFGEATCASVGSALSVKDFIRIGEPA